MSEIKSIKILVNHRHDILVKNLSDIMDYREFN